MTAFYALVGLIAGICSGLFGIGGGVVIVPLLVYFGRLSQHTATGISLVALLLPVGALAVFEYYQSGKITKIDIAHGLLIAAGLFIGAIVGAKLGLHLSGPVLQKSFAVFTILVGLRLLLA